MTRSLVPHPFRRRRSGRPPRSGSIRLGSAALLLALGGCGELVFHPPAPAPALLELAVEVEAEAPAAGAMQVGAEGSMDAVAAMAGAAFDEADAVRVTVRRGGALVLEVVEAMEPAGSDRRVRLQVPAAPEPETVQVEVELLFEGAALFRGGNESVLLAAGQTTAAEVSLAPVPDRVALEAGPVVLTALEAEREVEGGVVFATGDAYPGAVLAWTTDNAEAVTVDAAGRVRARAPGEARVTATFEGLSGSVVVRVEQAVAEVVVSPSSASLGLEEDLVLEARLRDGNGFAIPTAGRAVAWTSSNALRATVLPAGTAGVGPEGEGVFRTTARGVSEGPVTIRAEAEGVTGTAELVVAPLPDGTLVGRVVVEGTSIPVSQAQLEFRRSGQEGPGVTRVANTDGTFVAELRPGSYAVTLSASGFQDRLLPGVQVASGETTELGSLPLRPNVAQVAVFPSTLALAPGAERTLEVELTDVAGRPIPASGRSVSWSSADSLVAAVDAGGRVVGMAPGVTTVTASSEGATGSATVTVTLEGLPVEFPDPALETAVRAALERPEGDLLASDLLELTFLDAFEAGISDLAGLEAAENLAFLNLNENAVADLSPILELGGLVALGLYGNPLSDPTQLVRLPGLRELNLGETGTSSLAFLSDLPNLAALNIDGNGASDLGPLAGLPSLSFLYAPSNSISDLAPLSGLTELEFLYAANNDIADLGPLAGLLRLEELYLDLNDVEELGPLQNLLELRYLLLQGNAVEDLTPLGGLASLRVLDLLSNRIEGVGPLQTLTQLDYLDLEGNLISDLAPLVANSGLGDGDEIRVRFNPLSLDAVCLQIPALLSRGAVVVRDGFCPGYAGTEASASTCTGLHREGNTGAPPDTRGAWSRGTLLHSPQREVYPPCVGSVSSYPQGAGGAATGFARSKAQRSAFSKVLRVSR